ncbi:methyltransferase [Parapedobacter defluvii]|uniref:Methyltransferase n=1 Tax=Parapedobacter defluvii TaxID=2045106 RepID=A0ABQ1L9R1_9SPHI|nr:class I SAM-dependent methyltransferase [Parapedobacter defluvii]RQP17845.1 MAG: class I SAM-dependent methyltransferase [Parapedobacter sp.]GGC21847.1 methyltransferase [Parapedobacter defluvii]
MVPDVLGNALHDYFLGNTREKLMLHTSYGDLEEMPVEVFFREPDEFPELEHIALALCDGRILDVGAGVGSHALYLQEQGVDVTALEFSPGACAVMHKRGVQKVLQQDFFNCDTGQYDTLLFLMNGIGLAGTIAGLSTLLRHCRSLLRQGGQLLFDSSDISYLYADGSVEKPHGYQGEIRYQYEYKGETGEPFNWLFIDQEMLTRIARTEGWVVQVVFEDGNDQYLARMEPMAR